jgi:cullin-4
MILTQSYWPTYPHVDFQLPQEVVLYQEAFRRFYVAKYQNRILQWQNALGQCSIKARFKTGVKELLLTAFQATVLLLFNGVSSPDLPQEGSLTFSEIAQASKLDPAELKRVLQSMACAKLRILTKEPKSKDVQETDTFSVNTSFSTAHVRVRIPTIQAPRAQEDEDHDTRERVFQDRQYQIDAAIVRTMKTRKRMTYNQLFTQIMEQLKFDIHSTMLKKRIESLMEREYLERDEKERDMYIYLA